MKELSPRKPVFIARCKAAYTNAVAPGLRIGRGLELKETGQLLQLAESCARSSDRARIGTSWCAWRLAMRTVAPGLRIGRGLELQAPRGADDQQGCARSSDRARIGTITSRATVSTTVAVAPGLRIGRGLEHESRARDAETRRVAPGLRIGRGLERAYSGGDRGIIIVAPRSSDRARIGTALYG